MIVFGVHASPGRRVEGADPTEYLVEVSNRLPPGPASSGPGAHRSAVSSCGLPHFYWWMEGVNSIMSRPTAAAGAFSAM